MTVADFMTLFAVLGRTLPNSIIGDYWNIW